MHPSLPPTFPGATPLVVRLLVAALALGVALAGGRAWRATRRACLGALAVGAALLLLDDAVGAVLSHGQLAFQGTGWLIASALVQAAGLSLLAWGAGHAGQAENSTWLLGWLTIASCAFGLLLGVLPSIAWQLLGARAPGEPAPQPEWTLLLGLGCTAALLSSLRHRALARSGHALQERVHELGAAQEQSQQRETALQQQYEQAAQGRRQQQDSVEQLARRAANLQAVLQSSLSLNRRQELGQVLEAVVESAHERLGQPRVLLRLYNSRTHLFEARAFAGLPENEVRELRNRDVTMEDFLSAARAGAGLGGCAVVDPWAPPPPSSSPLGWRAGRQLVVPIRGDDGAVLGYLGVDEPNGVQVPAAETAELLEALASQAAIAIQNAQLHGQLERKNLEVSMANEKLRDLNRLKSNFVATVSHELRTPLTSIKAYSDTLQAALDDMEPQTVREFVSVISAESERLTGVIDDILDVSRLESGRAPMVKESFNFSALCQEAGVRMDAQFKAKGLRLRLECPPSEVVLSADRSAIEQLLVNLLDNALKFTPEGGEVRLHLEEEVSLARLVVEDSGIGIPEEEMERIFDRFYQVDGSTTRAYGGQGLGLAICRDIVEWHDGRIWVERAGGRGTRFVVLLPRKELVIHSNREDSSDVSERMQREEFLQLLTTLTAELMGTRIASIMLVDPASDALRIEAAVGLEEEVVHGARLRKGEGIAGRVWSEGRSILVHDLRGDARFAGRMNDVQYSTRSLLSAPLRRGTHVFGVVNVNNKINGQVFDEDDRLLLEALGERLVKAFDSLEAYRVGHHRLVAARSALRAILDVSRDRWSSLRELVARSGLDAARRLGMHEDDLRALAYVLKTYDLGLARVGEQILRKISPLSAEDRERINDHVRAGAELATEVEPLAKVRQILYHHHENVDGSGYPDGLAGEAIPVGARLVRLTDVFGALLHDRPFRRALSLDEAVALIREGVGRRFCPRVSSAFLAAVEGKRREFHTALTVLGGRSATAAPSTASALPGAPTPPSGPPVPAGTGGGAS